MMGFRLKQALELEGSRGEMREKEGTSKKRLGGQRLSKLKTTFIRIDAKLCCMINNPSSQWLNPTPFFLRTIPFQQWLRREKFLWHQSFLPKLICISDHTWLSTANPVATYTSKELTCLPSICLERSELEILVPGKQHISETEIVTTIRLDTVGG